MNEACQGLYKKQECHVHLVDARCDAVANRDVDEAVHGPKAYCRHGSVHGQWVVAGPASEDDRFAVGVDLPRCEERSCAGLAVCIGQRGRRDAVSAKECVI